MFTGSLDDKTQGHLDAFLAEGLREGLRLDYKRDFPSNLEKTIAAMANTEGGLILIGVDEDPVRPRHPLLPAIGVSAQGAEERVVSKAFEAVHEPVFPEVRAFPLPDDPDRVVVVVRVSPSERAPHAVGARNNIYVRVDSQSIPAGAEAEVPMALDRIEWLFRRRQVNAALLTEAEERAREVLQFEAGDAAQLFLTVRPTLAHAVPLAMAQLASMAGRPSRGKFDLFPDGQLRSVHGGYVSLVEPRATYVDVTGLAAHASTIPIGPEERASPPAARVMQPYWIPRATCILNWAGRAAIGAGRGGSLTARLELTGIDGAALKLGAGVFFMANRQRALQNAVTVEVVRPAEELARDPSGATVELTQRVAHAFDHDLSDEHIRKFFGGYLETE